MIKSKKTIANGNQIMERWKQYFEELIGMEDTKTVEDVEEGIKTLK